MADHLATYLKDHFAGAEMALELLGLLQAAHTGTPLGEFAAQLQAEVSADRAELESLMGRLNFGPSRTRQAFAWVSEKVARLKLRLDDPAGGDLRLFEILEALSLGIEGKRLLWLALSAASVERPELRGMDYDRLIRRAEEQRARVETRRLEAARAALAAAPAESGSK